MTQPREPKLIGQLNGKWSILFRAMLATVAAGAPMLIALNAWYVVTIYDLNRKIDVFIGAGPRYTKDMAERDLLLSQSTIATNVEERLDRIREQLDKVNQRLTAIEARSTP